MKRNHAAPWKHDISPTTTMMTAEVLVPGADTDSSYIVEFLPTTTAGELLSSLAGYLNLNNSRWTLSSYSSDGIFKPLGDNETLGEALSAVAGDRVYLYLAACVAGG